MAHLYVNQLAIPGFDNVKDIGAGNFGIAKLMKDRASGELVAVKFIERGEKVAAASRCSSRRRGSFSSPGPSRPAPRVSPSITPAGVPRRTSPVCRATLPQLDAPPNPPRCYLRLTRMSLGKSSTTAPCGIQTSSASKRCSLPSFFPGQCHCGHMRVGRLNGALRLPLPRPPPGRGCHLLIPLSPPRRLGVSGHPHSHARGHHHGVCRWRGAFSEDLRGRPLLGGRGAAMHACAWFACSSM